MHVASGVAWSFLLDGQEAPVPSVVGPSPPRPRRGAHAQRCQAPDAPVPGRLPPS